MSRHSGIRVLAGAGLLVVMVVLGLAAKIGRDTSQYLQTVSAQRNWDSPGSGVDTVATGRVEATEQVAESGGASAAGSGVVASR